MITIKEEFYGHSKAIRAFKLGGSDALLLWHLLKAFASTGSDGFVPDEAIEDFPLRVRGVKKCLEALKDCGNMGPDGVRCPGLLSKVEHGWQLHDYLDHANSSDEIEDRKQRDRERKQAQRDRSKLKVSLVNNGMSNDEAGRLCRAISRSDVLGRLEEVARETMTEVTRKFRGSSADSHINVPRDASCGGARAPAVPSPAQPSPLSSKDADADPRPPSNGEQRRQQPTDIEAALKVPIRERAQILVDEPQRAQWLQPHKWPEVQDFGNKFSKAVGWYKPNWRAPSRTSERLVALLAEFPVEDLKRATAAAQADPDWFKGQGLSSLSDEVIRRCLSGQKKQAPKVKQKSPVDLVHDRRMANKAKELGIT